MPKQISDAAKEARELVMRLEAHYPDPNKLQAELGKLYSKAEAQTPRERILTQHTIEIARAYAGVSDGKGGVDNNRANRTTMRSDPAMDRYRAALNGFMPDGRSPLTSQREALSLGLQDLLTENVAKTNNIHFKRPAERVNVGMGGHSRPSRGFATVAMMAATTVITALSIPALKHLGSPTDSTPAQSPDTPVVHVESLQKAATGLAPATPLKGAPGVYSSFSVVKKAPGGPS